MEVGALGILERRTRPAQPTRFGLISNLISAKVLAVPPTRFRKSVQRSGQNAKTATTSTMSNNATAISKTPNCGSL